MLAWLPVRVGAGPQEFQHKHYLGLVCLMRLGAGSQGFRHKYHLRRGMLAWLQMRVSAKFSFYNTNIT